MANIIAYIRKEQEKGNSLIDTMGNFLPEEKVNTKLKKSFIDGLKNGEIDFSKSFDDYCAEEKESCYTSIEWLLAKIEESIGMGDGDISEDMQEPVEETTEEVAN